MSLLRVIFILLCLPVIILSCSKDAVGIISTDSDNQAKLTSSEGFDALQAGYKTYTIEQGKHYANGSRFPIYSGKLLAFAAVFDSSAIYNFTDPKTKYDQNTLYGFADNGQKHQNFSARFGWRWFDGELQIAAYATNFGDSTIVQLGTVPLGKISNYAIAVNGNHYDFTLNGVTTSLPRSSTTATAGNYKLLPYFGGDATAPQKITIRIKDK